MLYLILSIILLILALLFYKIFKKDIISPSVISAFVFSISTFAAFLGLRADSWNIYQLDYNVFSIILIGVLSFFVGELIVFKTEKNNTTDSKFSNKIIRVDALKLFICIVFLLITTILIFYSMKKMTGETEISKIIASYRFSSELFNKNALEEGFKISTTFMMMFRLCEIINVIFVYIIVKNLTLKDKIYNNIPYMTVVLLFSALTLMLGGRSGILKVLLEFVVLWIILSNKKTNINIYKFLKTIFKIGVIIIILFYFMLPLLGRKTQANFLDYTTFYLGSPLPSFSNGLQTNLLKSNYFGELTLKGFQAVLGKFGVLNYSNYQTYWIFFKQNLSSNVFSSMAAPYFDFGITGIIICQFLFGYIFTKLYYRAKYKQNIRFLIFYAFEFYLLVDQFRSEKLFTVFFHYNTLVFIIFVIFMTWFLFGSGKTKKGEI